ncbi:hypothetical protein [Emcibacter nanhaiensis]|uniref:Uncharacterized protein n=1 Tax=Emcibacter nanhaiensis TaxID=1505037 RepID=A0A501PR47_9PROT|nr:hypothetical protein [Emcibacter nanhaiensis]TPD62999.1 hypothetical protein FIV46_02660 [Emcibacter nanhaiensis]
MSLFSEILGEDLGSVVNDFGRSYLDLELLKKQIGLQSAVSTQAAQEQAIHDYLEGQESVQQSQAIAAASNSGLPTWAIGASIALGAAALLGLLLRK